VTYGLHILPGQKKQPQNGARMFIGIQYYRAFIECSTSPLIAFDILDELFDCMVNSQISRPPKKGMN
jgi:hypothetical protein